MRITATVALEQRVSPDVAAGVLACRRGRHLAAGQSLQDYKLRYELKTKAENYLGAVLIRTFSSLLRTEPAGETPRLYVRRGRLTLRQFQQHALPRIQP